MLNFKIDENKCIKCAKCSKDCPMQVIKISEESKMPFIPAEKEDSCIMCQHCLAVCPSAALSINDIDPLKSVSINSALIESDKMEALIRCRRSCRTYLDENLSSDMIYKMLEVAANAPTGVNSRGVVFSVI